MEKARLGRGTIVTCGPFNPACEATVVFDRRDVGRRLEEELADLTQTAGNASYLLTRNGKTPLGVTFTGEEMRLELGLTSNLVVTRHAYRTASIRSSLLTVPRGPMRELEDRFVELAGVHPDNHVVYVLRDASDSVPEPRLYAMFSDSKVHFGVEVERKRW